MIRFMNLLEITEGELYINIEYIQTLYSDENGYYIKMKDSSICKISKEIYTRILSNSNFI